MSIEIAMARDCRERLARTERNYNLRLGELEAAYARVRELEDVLARLARRGHDKTCVICSAYPNSAHVPGCWVGDVLVGSEGDTEA